MLIDTHCHLDFPEYQDSTVANNIPFSEVLNNMKGNGIDFAITIGVNLENWQQVHQIALENENIYCSVGVHPDYQNAREPSIDELIEKAKLPKVVAIGECGLDYFHCPDKPKWQEERFVKHIIAAKTCQKPLIIHSRDCGNRMIEILKSERINNEDPGVMHCFTDSWDIAKAAIDLGFYISFSGIVTFKNARLIHEVATKVPADRYLIETDAPYLAPTPYRGKTNQPAYVRYVAEAIAKLRNTEFNKIAEQSTENAVRLFKLPIQ